MIPLSTTTIAVRRRPTGQDAYEEGGTTDVAEGIAAHIGSPTGQDLAVGGDAMQITDRLLCDPCDIRPGDRVEDEQNVDTAYAGVFYDVIWVRNRRGLGLDHVVAGLRQSLGAANG